MAAQPMTAALHVPELPMSAVRTSRRDWFATGDLQISVPDRIALLERAPNRSDPASDHGHGVLRFLFDEPDLELQSARMRVQKLESMIKRQSSRTSFESVLSREPPPGLPTVPCRSMSACASDKVFPTTERDRERGFEGPFSEVERGMLDALHAQDAHPHDASPPPDGDPGDSSSSSSTSDDNGARKRKKKKRKKGQKDPYKVKNAEMRLPQYPNAHLLVVEACHSNGRHFGVRETGTGARVHLLR